MCLYFSYSIMHISLKNNLWRVSLGEFMVLAPHLKPLFVASCLSNHLVAHCWGENSIGKDGSPFGDEVIPGIFVHIFHLLDFLVGAVFGDDHVSGLEVSGLDEILDSVPVDDHGVGGGDSEGISLLGADLDGWYFSIPLHIGDCLCKNFLSLVVEGKDQVSFGYVLYEHSFDRSVMELFYIGFIVEATNSRC